MMLNLFLFGRQLHVVTILRCEVCVVLFNAQELSILKGIGLGGAKDAFLDTTPKTIVIVTDIVGLVIVIGGHQLVYLLL